MVIEDVVDHTNVGAVLRNAAALGWDGALLAPRAADPLYRRAIKVSMGAVFSLPWARLADWASAPDLLRAAGFTTVALTLADGCRRPGVPHAGAQRRRAAPGSRVAILLGTEGAGLSRALDAAAPTSGPDSDAGRDRLVQRRRRVGDRLLRAGLPGPGPRALAPAVGRRLIVRVVASSATASPQRSASSSCWEYSFLRARPASRSPKTVPLRWSVSCCRQRASRPVPTTSTSSPYASTPRQTA